MRELTATEINEVSGASNIMAWAWNEILNGSIGAGGGMAGIGAGLAMDSGIAAGMVISGGALATIGGAVMIGWGAYDLYHYGVA